MGSSLLYLSFRAEVSPLTMELTSFRFVCCSAGDHLVVDARLGSEEQEEQETRSRRTSCFSARTDLGFPARQPVSTSSGIVRSALRRLACYVRDGGGCFQVRSCLFFLSSFSCRVELHSTEQPLHPLAEPSPTTNSSTNPTPVATISSPSFDATLSSTNLSVFSTGWVRLLERC